MREIKVAEHDPFRKNGSCFKAPNFAAPAAEGKTSRLEERPGEPPWTEPKGAWTGERWWASVRIRDARQPLLRRQADAEAHQQAAVRDALSTLAVEHDVRGGRLDGAVAVRQRARRLRHRAYPLSRRLISAGIFSLTLCWNEFIYALTFISSTDNKTVPVAIVSEFVDGDIYRWGSLMAGALVGSLPLVILYSFFVEHYVSAMTGAVKE
jgi:hypothetical protein